MSAIGHRPLENGVAPGPRTLATKIWDQHVVKQIDEATALLHIDRVFLHERAAGILAGAEKEGVRIANPALLCATMDHVIDTDPERTDATKIPRGTEYIRALRGIAAKHGLRLFDLGDPRQGIAHVVAAEQGFALPGATLVCADSHTCTLGGLGLLAWGVGISDIQHALATQCMRRRRPRQMRVRLDGPLAPGVFAKDLILQIIARFGANGGNASVVEFAGTGIQSLPIEARLTLCNMAVEFGAWTAIVAPDDATLEYFHDRPFAPKDRLWDLAVAHWKQLRTDDDAQFDQELTLSSREIAPTVTWGTSPQHAVPIDAVVPDPACEGNPAVRSSISHALEYMDLRAGTAMQSIPIEAAFIGSCTNSRISDLRAAAEILKGRKVAPGVLALCVPGSTQVRLQAEAEGLDKVFREAGFQWRQAGCSLCFFADGDSFGSARRTISSTNRNFPGRQGPGVRTHLASPATVAASAINGKISDPRGMMR